MPKLQYEFITERGRITPGELICWMDLHHMTQAELAKALGLSTKTVNAWCCGRSRTPKGLHDELAKRFGKPYAPRDHWD